MLVPEVEAHRDPSIMAFLHLLEPTLRNEGSS
jgi:hypothetical protein